MTGSGQISKNTEVFLKGLIRSVKENRIGLVFAKDSTDTLPSTVRHSSSPLRNDRRLVDGGYSKAFIYRWYRLALQSHRGNVSWPSGNVRGTV